MRPRHTGARWISRHAASGTIIGLFGIVLAGCGGGNDDANPRPADSLAPASLSAATTCNQPNFQQDMLDRVNQARAAGRICGSTSYPAADPLSWNDQLFAAAAGHAQDMAANNYFSHTSQDGRSFSQRISASGYDWSAVAENIAAGQMDVATVVNGWLQSPGHCANIMSRSYTEIGVSCVRNGSSSYGQYWAMELGNPR